MYTGWIEDEQGNKIQSPVTVLPPVQRIEPGKPAVKNPGNASDKNLPQDRETVYYFNLRNPAKRVTSRIRYQIALQTRIKLFYRPAAIAMVKTHRHRRTTDLLRKENDKYVVINPTAYYITLVDAATKNGLGIKTSKPVMVPPKSSLPLRVSVAEMGNSPVLTLR